MLILKKKLNNLREKINKCRNVLLICGKGKQQNIRIIDSIGLHELQETNSENMEFLWLSVIFL
jgi:hypothetical protein